MKQTCISKTQHILMMLFSLHIKQGKAGKYTEYSKETGITKDAGQSTLQNLHEDTSLTAMTCDTEKLETPQKKKSSSSLSATASFPTNVWIETIRKFAYERDWTVYHLPRNLVLAMIGELGELAELFQFHGDDDDTGNSSAPDDTTTNASSSSTTIKSIPLHLYDKLGQEMADVTIYLLRLADVCGLHIMDATHLDEPPADSGK